MYSLIHTPSTLVGFRSGGVGGGKGEKGEGEKVEEGGGRKSEIDPHYLPSSGHASVIRKGNGGGGGRATERERELHYIKTKI